MQKPSLIARNNGKTNIACGKSDGEAEERMWQKNAQYLALWSSGMLSNSEGNVKALAEPQQRSCSCIVEFQGRAGRGSVSLKLRGSCHLLWASRRGDKG